MTRPGGMRASFVKDIPVILKIDQMDPRIIPDLSVSVDVVVESEQQATLAPLSAVFRDSARRYALCVRQKRQRLGAARGRTRTCQ